MMLYLAIIAITCQKILEINVRECGQNSAEIIHGGESAKLAQGGEVPNLFRGRKCQKLFRGRKCQTCSGGRKCQNLRGEKVPKLSGGWEEQRVGEEWRSGWSGNG